MHGSYKHFKLENIYICLYVDRHNIISIVNMHYFQLKKLTIKYSKYVHTHALK